MSIETWTRAVIGRRVVVLTVWLTVVLLGAAAATGLPSLLVNSLSVPGSGSQHAEAILARSFGESTEGTFVVAFRERDQSAAARRRLQQRVDAAARALPHAHAGRIQQGHGVAYADVATSLDLQAAERLTPRLRRALSASSGPAALVTGEPALQYDLNPILTADLHRGDVIALIAALIILLIALGWSYAVAIPFLFAAATIASTTGLLWLLAHVLTISSYAPNLADLIGLGLAIDYSLLIVHRFRQELGRTDEVTGRTDEVTEAVINTMRTAGLTTLISGAAVALGLLVVLVTPVPFVRSLGLAGLLVPLTSMLAVLTLQPALLSLLGRRLLRHRSRPAQARKGWSRLAASVTRHRRILVLGSLATLVVCAAPAVGLRLTPGSITAIPQAPASARGLSLLSADAGPGEITPVEVVIDTGMAGGTARADVHSPLRRLADVISNDPEAYITAYGWKAPYVSSDRRYARIFVVGRHDFGAGAMQALVRRLRDREIPAAQLPANARAYVGGASAQGVDYLRGVYGPSLWSGAAVLVVTFVVLLIAFGSLPLAISAVLLNALSAFATLGLLVVVFRDGVGNSVLSLYSEPAVEGWVPIFLVAMLFGLSMDYEVFLVLRMREEHDRGRETIAAVREGLAQTGPVITAAAAIMVAAFSGFLVGRVAGLQEFGAGLALAVALDATVVRLLLVPGLVSWLGARAWWMPGRSPWPPRRSRDPEYRGG